MKFNLSKICLQDQARIELGIEALYKKFHPGIFSEVN